MYFDRPSKFHFRSPYYARRARLKMSNNVSYIFDCDGVILDSNKIKSSAFWAVANERFGSTVADKFLRYHLENGGVSRFQKFEWLHKAVLQKANIDELKLENDIQSYTDQVSERLLGSPLTAGIEDLLKNLPPAKCFVNSGGFESELRSVFHRKGIDHYFNSIFGSPSSKHENIARIKTKIGETCSFIFFGDSKLDYEVAMDAGASFYFVYGYTEFAKWKEFFKDKPKVRKIENFRALDPSRIL